MPFTWSNRIDMGELLTDELVKEIKDNLDYLYDNLACVAVDSSVYAMADSSFDGSLFSSRNDGDDGAVQSVDDHGYKLLLNSTVDSSNDSSVNNNDNSLVKGSNNGTVKGSVNSGYRSGNNPARLTGNFSSVKNSDNNTVYSANDYSYDTSENYLVQTSNNVGVNSSN
jgi:hypothetical protein